jgi:hypothetical protein
VIQVATYQGFVIRGEDGEFTKVTISESRYDNPPKPEECKLWLKLPNGDIKSPGEIRSSDVTFLCEKHNPWKYKS